MTEEVKTDEKLTSRRQPRALERRAFDTRKSGERAPLEYQTLSRFNLPDTVNQDNPDIEMRWVLSGYNNTRTDNYYTALEKGYEPVTVLQHPEIARIFGINSRNTDGDNQYIIRGGQMLMKRSREMAEREAALVQMENELQLEYINKARVDDGTTNYWMDKRFNRNAELPKQGIYY